MPSTSILYIINYLAHGGTEKQLVELIRNLDRSVFSPHIATLGPSSALFDELNIPSIQVDFKGFGNRELFSQIPCLSRFIKEHQIRLVQTFFQDPHFFGTILKCVAPIKLIGSFRDMGFWRTFSGAAKIMLSDFLYDGYIANSEAVKDYNSKSFRISSDKIARIYNGFRLNGSRAPLGSATPWPPDSKVVGIVANLNRKVKRVEDFVRMAAVVRERVPGVLFAVLGEGHLKQELIALSASLGLGDNIVFLGSVPNPLDYMASFRVGVLTSESEGFSNSIIEYMACAVPVVATDAGGNPEMVVDGRNGYLVPVGNPSLMAEKVVLLLKNPRQGREMGLANQEKVRVEYGMDRMVAQHQAYYERVLSKGA